MVFQQKTNLVKIAQITSPKGLKGDVKLRLFSSRKNIASYKNFYFSDNKKIGISFNFNNPEKVFALIDGVDNIDKAMMLKGREIYIRDCDLADLTDVNEFYVKDLLGLEVVKTIGEPLGRIIAVDNYGGGDNLTIRFNDGKEQQYPFLSDIFIEIDLKKQIVIFKFPEFI